jgi:hypothetical protein
MLWYIIFCMMGCVVDMNVIATIRISLRYYVCVCVLLSYAQIHSHLCNHAWKILESEMDELSSVEKGNMSITYETDSIERWRVCICTWYQCASLTNSIVIANMCRRACESCESMCTKACIVGSVKCYFVTSGSIHILKNWKHDKVYTYLCVRHTCKET